MPRCLPSTPPYGFFEIGVRLIRFTLGWAAATHRLVVVLCWALAHTHTLLLPATKQSTVWRWDFPFPAHNVAAFVGREVRPSRFQRPPLHSTPLGVGWDALWSHFFYFVALTYDARVEMALIAFHHHLHKLLLAWLPSISARVSERIKGTHRNFFPFLVSSIFCSWLAKCLPLSTAAIRLSFTKQQQQQHHGLCFRLSSLPAGRYKTNLFAPLHCPDSFGPFPVGRWWWGLFFVAQGKLESVRMGYVLAVWARWKASFSRWTAKN